MGNYWKVFFSTFLLILFGVINPQFANAVSIPLSAFGQTNTCNWPSSNNYGALLYAGSTTSITQIRIQYQNSTTTAEFNQNTLKIYSDVGTAPSTLLGTLNPSNLGSGEYLFGSSIQTKTGTYTGNVPVNSGNRFWLVMSTSGSSITACQTTAMVTQSDGWIHVMNGSQYQFRINSSNFAYSTIFTYEITVGSSAPDTTAPTFTSSTSFSAAENISTSATAATIKVSESATVTISSGADSSLFNIYFSDSVTALIKFKVSPDFEAPTDVGGNNVYEITLTATDLAANTGTQAITITVTDVVDTSSFNSLSLSGAATYRQVITITANVSVASRVTFRAKNMIISGCKNKLTSGSSPNIIATCSWRPSTRGAVVITATAVPTGAGISGTTATPVSILVGNRSGSR